MPTSDPAVATAKVGLLSGSRIARGAARLLLLLAVLVLPVHVGAQDTTLLPAAQIQLWESEANGVAQDMERNRPGAAKIEEHLATLGRQLTEAPALIERLGAEIAPVQAQLDALGSAPEDLSTEAPQIGLERKRLQSELTQLEAVAKRADQLAARAKGLETQLLQMRRDRFRDELLTRGPSVLDASTPPNAIASILRTATGIWTETETRVHELSMDPATVTRLVSPLVLFAMALFLLLRLRRRSLRWLIRQVSEETPYSRRISIGAGITLARLLLPAVAVAMIIASLVMSGLLGPLGTQLADGLARTALVVIGAYALGGAFFSPSTPLLRLSGLEECDARAAHRWLILLALVVGVDRALVEQGDAIGLEVEGLALLNTVLLCLGGVVLWCFISTIRPPRMPEGAAVEPGEDDDEEPRQVVTTSSMRLLVNGVRIVARAAAILAPILALLGYFAAARFAFFPIVFTIAVLGTCILLFHIVEALVSALARPDADSSAVKRLQLIPIMVGVLLTCVAVPVLALVWGVAVADLSAAWRKLISGFQIGEVKISPTDFFLFVAVLIAGFFVTSHLKRLLRTRVLPLTGLDTGGRDAIAAGSGYLGIVATLLIAISTTGVDLSNLAIVAGALSVGIGFGLQNIVNNFVSGIILLIERPVKAGDWIELPSGMGYVKTINVRSTEVETFDRASLFVPNSQLIAENVINWTHTNLHGRIIVQVGVEYGSDPRHVEKVLTEIARAHPLMLRKPGPYVLFRGFGADSLDFEIRGVLRDVNWILNVQSDINFEIARRFKEEGIGVPFRQADIELKNPERIADALRSAFQPPADDGEETDEPPGDLRKTMRHHRRRPNRQAAGKDADGDGDGDAS